jgi:hypothetical protein
MEIAIELLPAGTVARLDSLLVYCLANSMSITIHLPDDLLFRAQARAAQEGRELEQLIEEYVEVGLRTVTTLPQQPIPRSPLPVIRLPNHIAVPALTGSELQRLLEIEDVAELNDGSA